MATPLVRAGESGARRKPARNPAKADPQLRKLGLVNDAVRSLEEALKIAKRLQKEQALGKGNIQSVLTAAAQASQAGRELQTLYGIMYGEYLAE